MAWFEAGKNNIPIGGMRRVEVGGKEILLTNFNGKVYATDDRCGHMNAPLSRGNLVGNVVECRLHHARFDVTNGKMLEVGRERGITGAVISHTKIGEAVEMVRTYDLGTYPVEIREGMVWLSIEECKKII